MPLSDCLLPQFMIASPPSKAERVFGAFFYAVATINFCLASCIRTENKHLTVGAFFERPRANEVRPYKMPPKSAPKQTHKQDFILLTFQKKSALYSPAPLLSVPIRRAEECARYALGHAPPRPSNWNHSFVNRKIRTSYFRV